MGGPSTTARTRCCQALLVVGPPGAELGVVAPLAATAQPAGGRGGKLRFVGAVPVTRRTRQHLRRVVAATVHEILDQLGCPRPNWQLTLANSPLAARRELTLEANGFSLDAAALLAMLAAALALPLPTSLAVTGHLASPRGHLTAVRGLPAKLAAAAAHATVRQVIHPPPATDDEQAALTAQALELTADAELTLTAAPDIAALVQAAFSAQAVLDASLQNGFFRPEAGREADGDPLAALVRHWTVDVPARFWPLVRQRALAGQLAAVREWLADYAQLHVDRQCYPPAVGRELAALYASLPPTLRRGLTAPLLADATALDLSKHAPASAAGDVALLFQAASAGRRTARPARGSGDGTPAENVAWVLTQLSTETIATEVTAALDFARATYPLTTIVVADHDELLDTLTAFCNHLHTAAGVPGWGVTAETATAAAYHLVAAAFHAEGGFKAAATEARSPLRGGLRHVLDRMADQLKQELTVQHVQSVLRQAVDPLDDAELVAFTAALVDRLADHLPAQLRNRRPELLAHCYDQLAQAYVQSLDQFARQVRRL